MPVYFVHAPYMQASREQLITLQQSGADIVYSERWQTSDDERYDFAEETQESGVGNYISTLPTILLLHDDHKTVLSRIDKREHMTKSNVDWLHKTHDEWKKGGNKGKFPVAPWHKK